MVWKPVADGFRVEEFNRASGRMNKAIQNRSERYDPSNVEGRPKRMPQGIAAEGAASQGKDQRPSQAARPVEWRLRPARRARQELFLRKRFRNEPVVQGTRICRKRKAALRTGPRMADGSGLRTGCRSAKASPWAKPGDGASGNGKRPGKGPARGSERPDRQRPGASCPGSNPEVRPAMIEGKIVACQW